MEDNSKDLKESSSIRELMKALVNNSKNSNRDEELSDRISKIIKISFKDSDE